MLASRAVNARIALLLLFSLALTSSACANLCQRKETFFKTKCAGVLAYSDPTCEMNLDRCNDQQTASMEGYVSCLEALPQCSMDAIASCGERYPGGVNLMCTGT